MTTTAKPKPRQVRVLRKRLESIKPSPENTKLYHPVLDTDPEVIELAKSIRKHGIQEPLVISADNFILSGHRRYVAAGLAGLVTVPVRVHQVHRRKQPDKFVVLLREFNRQRVKSLDEKLREEVVSTDPNEAYWSLIEHRQQQSKVSATTIKLRGQKKRSKITKAKYPFLEAIQEILKEYRNYWPFSVRQIHYYLLNDPPLKHASKPDSRYVNDRNSYQSLDELTVRARLVGQIPMEAIGDETRPVTVWSVHQDTQGFIRQELNGFLKGYWRGLMQSQSNHFEIVGEKLTLQGIIRPVAMEYCIPCTLGRGFANLPVRVGIIERWQRSGKENLVLLFLADFDPDGEEIVHSFARSLRDDFDIDEDQIIPVKVALTSKQVVEFELPPKMEAKETSANYDRFVIEHGHTVFELEALAPDQLQDVLRETIDGTIDIDAFNCELNQEKQDAAFLQGMRRTTHRVLAELVDGDAAEDEA